MKSILKKILPWHVWNSLGWFRYFHARRKPPFEGIYARFDEVPLAAGWHADRWTEYSRIHAEKARRGVGPSLPESPQPSKALLPLLAASFSGYGDRPVRILDFGGAGGLDYASLLSALGNPRGDEVRYHVVDMPEACAAGREVWRDDARVSFGELPDPRDRFDIVYADGALHMVEDYRALIGRFADYQPAFMLFCKVSMHEGPGFVRRQVNMGPDMENAQWVLGFAELTAAMEDAGYFLTFRAYGQEKYNVDNYPLSHRAGRTTHLLFRRMNPCA
jgi:putative methyltransferase (TIGR04325 family)